MYVDDTTNPDTAVSKVNDLIYNQKVVAVIGGRHRTRNGPATARRDVEAPLLLPLQVARSKGWVEHR